jgi:hypothetical protein
MVKVEQPATSSKEGCIVHDVFKHERTQPSKNVAAVVSDIILAGLTEFGFRDSSEIVPGFRKRAII